MPLRVTDRKMSVYRADVYSMVLFVKSGRTYVKYKYTEPKRFLRVPLR